MVSLRDRGLRAEHDQADVVDLGRRGLRQGPQILAVFAGPAGDLGEADHRDLLGRRVVQLPQGLGAGGQHRHGMGVEAGVEVAVGVLALGAEPAVQRVAEAEGQDGGGVHGRDPSGRSSRRTMTSLVCIVSTPINRALLAADDSRQTSQGKWAPGRTFDRR